MHYNSIILKVGDKVLINGVKKEIISMTKSTINEQVSDNTLGSFLINSITTN